MGMRDFGNAIECELGTPLKGEITMAIELDFAQEKQKNFPLFLGKPEILSKTVGNKQYYGWSIQVPNGFYKG